MKTDEQNSSADKADFSQQIYQKESEGISDSSQQNYQKPEGGGLDSYRQIYQRADDGIFTEQPKQRAEYFKALGLPSLLYAVVYAVCTYRYNSGITMLIWIAATIIYACASMKALAAMRIKRMRAALPMDVEVHEGAANADETHENTASSLQLKAGSVFYIGIMLLLGISTFLTDNAYIIFFNYAGFFLILTAFLLHNFYDDSKWDFAKSIAETAAAVLGAVGCMFTPFSDGSAFYMQKERKKNPALRAAVIGFACAVPVMLVLGVCLMDADAVFRLIVMRLFAGFELRISKNTFWFICMLLFGFFSSYCGMRFLALQKKSAETEDRKQFAPAAALAFTGVIAAMYSVFCGVQVVYLFAGSMRLPEGMTYAEYARSGFFQLLFVCFVNLCMVLLIKKYFARHKCLDMVLLVICACTFIMLSSSAYRMVLYIAAYQLTFLRMAVLAALAALALLMGGTAAMVLKPGFSLFNYSVTVVSVVYLAFSFSHVDYFIASYNLSHAAENTDWQYLTTISLDAAPAVARYYAAAPENQKLLLDAYAAEAEKLSENNQAEYLLETGWYGHYMYRVYEARKDKNPLNFNVSRSLAFKSLGDIR